jgi:hypothetical protein
MRHITSIELENQDIIKVNREYFRYIEWFGIRVNDQKKIPMCKMEKISKETAKKILTQSNVVHKTLNNPSCQTSDGTIGEGGFG